MTNTYKHPFATLGTLTSTAYDASAKTAINAAINSIIALFQPQTPSDTTSRAHPDFAQLPAATAASIVAELAALRDAITAHG